MYKVGGGYNNNPEFNPLASLRERFKKRSEQRFEFAKIEYQHSLGMQKAAMEHQYAQERLHQEWGYRGQESQAQRDFEGNQALANRTFTSMEGDKGREHDIMKMKLQAEIDTAARDQSGNWEIKSQREKGRQGRLDASKAQRMANELPPGAQASGGGMSASKPRNAPPASPSGNKKTTTANRQQKPKK